MNAERQAANDWHARTSEITGRPRSLADWAEILDGVPREFTRQEKHAAGYFSQCPVGLTWPDIWPTGRAFYDFDLKGQLSIEFYNAVKEDDFQAAEDIFNRIKDLKSNGN